MTYALLVMMSIDAGDVMRLLYMGVCMYTCVQAFGQSFLQSDIEVFRHNLEALENLNETKKLYTKVRESEFVEQAVTRMQFSASRGDDSSISVMGAPARQRLAQLNAPKQKQNGNLTASAAAARVNGCSVVFSSLFARRAGRGGDSRE